LLSRLSGVVVERPAFRVSGFVALDRLRDEHVVELDAAQPVVNTGSLYS
jgi:hypothetical protein